MEVRVCQLVHHVDPDWNISAALGWIPMKFCADTHGFPPDIGDPLTSPLAPPWGWCLWVLVQCFSNYFNGGSWNLLRIHCNNSLHPLPSPGKPLQLCVVWKALYKWVLLLNVYYLCVCVFQVAELEAQLGHPAAGQTGREELSQSLEELEALLSAKDQARHQSTITEQHVQKSKWIQMERVCLLAVTCAPLLSLSTKSLICLPGTVIFLDDSLVWSDKESFDKIARPHKTRKNACCRCPELPPTC